MLTEIALAPSILSADLLDLGREVESIAGARYIHFDVMDGSFVPQLSYGHPVLKALKAATDMPIDVHLMISNPDEAVASYIEAGADMVCFHIETAKHAHRIVSQIHEAGRRAGVALNPGTAVSSLESLIEIVDMVLVMSVDPGFGGQRFIPQTPAKIRELVALCESRHVSPIIEVDGGISKETAGSVAAAGADLLVAGSAVFNADDRAQAMRAILDAAEAGRAERV